MNKRISLKIFIGFQTISDFNSPADFQALGKRLVRYLIAQNPKVQAEIFYGQFPTGTQLWHGVSETISKCDLGIFDISENNHNVLIEAGFTLGQGKTAILLKNKSSSEKLPSDINSFVYNPYESKEKLSQQPLATQIGEAIMHFLRETHSHFYYLKSLWGLSPSSKTIIFSPKLSKEPRKFEFHLNIGRLGDLDALFLTTQTLCRLYPEMEISTVLGEESTVLLDNWESCNIVLIGGHRFNHFVKSKIFRDLSPVEYVDRVKIRDSEDWFLAWKDSGVEVYPEFIKHKHENVNENDFGFFLKRKLRPNGSNKFIMISGAGTLGVLGAIRLFGYSGMAKDSQGYKNSQLVVTKLGSDPSFIGFFEVIGGLKDITTPNLDINKVIEID